MAGGAFVVIALCCGIAGGVIGRIKGSSFFVWFLVCVIPPFVGLIAVILYRFESEEPDTVCPRCGKRVKLYEALCTRCGQELDPGYTDSSVPVAETRPA
jgi:DNA-directed RNA polymerase subunit RPC12/RpoP